MQQKQGHVQTISQTKGDPVNDASGLEKEADKMREKAINSTNKQSIEKNIHFHFLKYHFTGSISNKRVGIKK